MRTIRPIAFLLALALLVPLLFACGQDPGANTDPGPETVGDTESASVADAGTAGTEPESEPAVEPVTDILIAEKGTVHFTITNAPYLPDEVNDSITLLYQTIKRNADNGVVPVAEAIPASYRAEEPEILIGDTGYAESNEIMDRISYGDWMICFQGKKLVVAGYSGEALCAALAVLIQAIVNGAQINDSIQIQSDFFAKGTTNEAASRFIKYDCSSVSTLKIADEGQGTALAVIKKTNLTEYEAYLGKLEREGYTLYTSNIIGENRFATYINDDFLVHAGWYAYEKTARVTVEETKALAGLPADNVWTPKEGVTTSLAQFGIATEANNYAHEGMGYVFQLADGSFFVIDGGYYPEAERLYDYMKAKAPDGEIVIAAWLLTHNHADHCRAFVSFARTYQNQVRIESVIKNMPASATYKESNTWEDLNTHKVADALPDCKVIKAHTGMKFFLRNAEVEILCTIDSILPTPVKIFNDTSIVFMVTIEGERMLFTGDMGDDVAKFMVPMYGDYLKADFLQLAHHGMKNGHGKNMPNTISFYAKVRPEVILWPNSEKQYYDPPDDELIATFDWNLEAQKYARETWLAGGDDITVFELPYTEFSAYRFEPASPKAPAA